MIRSSHLRSILFAARLPLAVLATCTALGATRVEAQTKASVVGLRKSAGDADFHSGAFRFIPPPPDTANDFRGVA